MTSFRLISVAAAALLFAQLHEAGGDAAAPQDPPKPKNPDCLAKMNQERVAVGLDPFKTPTEPSKTVPTDENKVKAICEEFIKDNPKGVPYKDGEEAGTYSFYPAVGENVCSDAIDFWKSFRLPFTELPPVYKSVKGSSYDSYQTRALMVLFNPRPNPTIDCAVIECKYETEEAKRGADKQGQDGKSPVKPAEKSPAGEKEKEKSPHEILKECNGDRACVLAKSSGTLKSLVCVTFPPPLVNEQAPYTQEQWDKVRAHLSSGKMYSITAATSFVLAASALWLSAF